MTTRGKKSYTGSVHCDDLPQLEDDRMQLGLVEVVDIHLAGGEEEDVMNVTLFVSDGEIKSTDTSQIEKMIRRWDHRFNVITA